MPFRAQEAIDELRASFIRYEIQRAPGVEASQAMGILDDIEDRAGHIIGSRPLWHPIDVELRRRAEVRMYDTLSFDSVLDGHTDLHDHAYDFREGLLVMPYNDNAEKEATAFVQSLSDHVCIDGFDLSEMIGVQAYPKGSLHSEGVTPILFTFRWFDPVPVNNIAECKGKLRYVMECLADNAGMTCGETWKNMTGYMLGSPCGARSSVYTDQALGSRIKIIHDAINRAELHGAVQTARYCGPSAHAPDYVRRKSRWHQAELEPSEIEEERRANESRSAAIVERLEHLIKWPDDVLNADAKIGVKKGPKVRETAERLLKQQKTKK